MKSHLTLVALALTAVGLGLAAAQAAAPAAAPAAASAPAPEPAVAPAPEPAVAPAPEPAVAPAPEPAAAPTPEPPADRIVIDQFMFQPTTLTVKAGSTVTWLNMDEEPHTVVSASGLFRSVALDTNDKFTFKFTKPGTYPFVCSIHPQMIGTIVVQ